MIVLVALKALLRRPLVPMDFLHGASCYIPVREGERERGRGERRGERGGWEEGAGGRGGEDGREGRGGRRGGRGWGGRGGGGGRKKEGNKRERERGRV